MASAPLPLKIIEISRVAPPPSITPDCASLPFTFFDLIMTTFTPVDRIFFYPYRHPTVHFLSSHLPSLKRSLSLTLATYFPLAGGYRRKPGTDNELELYYKEGDGVSFTVAECVDGRFEDLANEHERYVSQLDFLVPLLPKSGADEESKPVFAVQVTVFPEQGIVIGTSMHHTVCDGSSFMPFMHTWSETCLSGVVPSSRVPVFDRSLFSDPSNLYPLFYKEIQHALISGPVGIVKPSMPPSDLVVAAFTFGQQHIQRLKQLVSIKVEQRKMSSFHCSTIVMVFAYVWTCFVRAKGIDSSKRAFIMVPANVRTRLQPPLPAEYFGNCVVPCYASVNVTDLIQDDGIVVAAEAIGKSIAQIREILLKSPLNWKPFTDVPVLNIAGSPKFRAYDIDFGLGRPTKLEIISATKKGVMTVEESRDEQGGIEIGIGFPKDEMDCFKKCFSDGLKLLF